MVSGGPGPPAGLGLSSLQTLPVGNAPTHGRIHLDRFLPPPAFPLRAGLVVFFTSRTSRSPGSHAKVSHSASMVWRPIMLISPRQSRTAVPDSGSILQPDTAKAL
jgi:hypothetical protein